MLKINAVYINICVCCYYSKPVAAILFTHGTTSGSASALIFSHRYNKIFTIQLAFITRLNQAQSKYLENKQISSFLLKIFINEDRSFWLGVFEKEDNKLLNTAQIHYTMYCKKYIFKNVVNCYKKL